MNRIEVSARGTLAFRGNVYACALGRAGVAKEKCEGDGATPTGDYPLRSVLYRPDRTGVPATTLPTRPIGLEDGWCDDPGDPHYNRMVSLPSAASAERLWRDDHLYDVIVVIGYNDEPIVTGRGSAIFLHVARDGYASTEGCIALAHDHLLTVLADCDTETVIRINA